MSEPSSSSFDRQLGEFSQRIEELQHQQQQLAYALCLVRLARDRAVLSDSLHARRSPFRYLLNLLSGLRHRVRVRADQPEDNGMVIVIDEHTTVVNGEREQ
jgi:hypothetical protein